MKMYLSTPILLSALTIFKTAPWAMAHKSVSRVLFVVDDNDFKTKSAPTTTKDIGRAPFRLRSSGAILPRPGSRSRSRSRSRFLTSTGKQDCEVVEFGRKLEGSSGAIISNGLIKLGVTEEGALNVPGGNPTNSADGKAETVVGLRYIFPDGRGEGESTSYGCSCEGWGIGALDESLFFNAANGNSPPSAYTKSFSYTESTAVSTVEYASGKLRVTHDFHPHPSTQNLYEVTVTIENIIMDNIADVPYRRVMDWDIYPTPFHECVTIQPDPSLVANLVNASNDGFLSANPYSFLDSIPYGYNDGGTLQSVVEEGSYRMRQLVEAEGLPLNPCDESLGPCEPFSHSGYAPFTDLGPRDHGTAFDFQFGPLNVGESVTFNLYYGAAANEQEAREALAIVAAEVYSIGKPSDPNTGVCTGEFY